MWDFRYPRSLHWFKLLIAAFEFIPTTFSNNSFRILTLFLSLLYLGLPQPLPSVSIHCCQIHFLRHSPALVGPPLKNLQLFSIACWIEPRILWEQEGHLCFSLYLTDSAWGGRNHCSWGEQGQGWEVSWVLLCEASVRGPLTSCVLPLILVFCCSLCLEWHFFSILL